MVELFTGQSIHSADTFFIYIEKMKTAVQTSSKKPWNNVRVKLHSPKSIKAE